MVTRTVERYGVYLADLDPARGSEIAKTRPVVIVSDDEMNRHLETVVVCPLDFFQNGIGSTSFDLTAP